LQNDFSAIRNLTFQWQSSTNGITFTDISGATAPTYVTTQSVTTWYHCVITCQNSGLSSTSSDLQVAGTSFLSCYCTPASNYYGYSTIYNPCSPLYYGETEDYTVTINCGQAITSSAGPNGSISLTGLTMITCGTDQTYTIIPDANYIVNDVLVDGSSVGPVT